LAGVASPDLIRDVEVGETDIGDQELTHPDPFPDQPAFGAPKLLWRHAECGISGGTNRGIEEVREDRVETERIVR
jgi:hypothetical protein